MSGALDRVKSLDAIADGLREAVGADEWFAIPQETRLLIIFHVRATLDATEPPRPPDTLPSCAKGCPDESERVPAGKAG